MNKYSWEPVRDGDIYCAPACGARCTHDAFIQANEDAEALCAKLGPEWKPRVWENMGWFYSVKVVDPETGYEAEVHSKKFGKHFCSIGLGGPKQFWSKDECPRKAFEQARLELQAFIRKLNKLNAMVDKL